MKIVAFRLSGENHGLVCCALVMY